MEEITNQWIADGNETWERIYKISTKNKSVEIILFSSIDIRTNEVRDNGNDRVRVVMKWKTRNGNMFKKIHHHNRLKTLFKNLEQTIIQTQSQVFDLNFKEFVKEAV